MNLDQLNTTLRIGAAALIGLSALAIGANGIYASLNATANNLTPQVASSGTLSLTLGAGTDSVGFTGNITDLAPGDVVNRYVDLTNGGTLPSTGLNLGIAATGTASLITDGSTSRALRVSIRSCSVAWNASNGTCAGVVNTEVAAAPLSAFASPQNFAVTTGLAAGGLSRLQVSVSLPDQNETTVNGVAPTGTIQGGSVNLTYTFTETQRDATITHG